MVKVCRPLIMILLYIIFLIITNYDVNRIFLDNGRLPDIFFYNAFCKMNIPSDQLRRVNSSIIYFLGDLVPVEGTNISLLITSNQAPR